MEAQYCGRPVVTLRTRSAEITVQDGRTGLLANDLDEFRAHLATLCGDPSRCDAMGAAARAYIATTHSIETRLGQIEELLIA
jgi:glycosyltransferase involved in cell wall biosynthesis